MPNASIGQPYSFTLQASGGTPPYLWTFPNPAGGIGIPGLTLSTSGVLSGTPTTPGTYNVSITLEDSGVANGGSGLATVQFTVNVIAALGIANTSFPNGAVGAPYSAALTASGGITGAQAWSLASGALPDGLTIGGSNSSFSISGTPSKVGTFSFVLQVTVNGNTASKAFSIAILGALQITTAALPGGTLNTPYSQTVAATGGVAPYVWSVSSGSLPSGLTLSSSSGTISGTPTQAGSFAVTISVTDSGGKVVSQSLTIVISGANSLVVPLTSLSFSGMAGGGVPPAQNLTVSSTAGPLSLTATVSPGSAWLVVNPISGSTPVNLAVSVSTAGLGPGTYNGHITIAAAAASNSPQTVNVTLSVSSAPTLTLGSSALNFAFQTGGAVPAMQSVAVGSSGAPLALTASSAASGGNWLSVSPSSGTTPVNLSVSVNPAGLGAGTYTGNVTVISPGASNSPQSILVTLTVSAATGPLPTVTALVNAASFQTGPVSPGELVSVGGTGIGPSTSAGLTLDQNGKVSTLLGGVQVLFNGLPAPLTYVSSTQINAIVPYEIQAVSSPFVQVKYQGQASNSFSLTRAVASPALFTSNGSGTGPAAALNQDLSYNTSQNPALKGGYLVLYMTGEGQTAPPGVTGQVTTESTTPPLTPQPVLPVTVLIGGQPASIAFYGEAPNLVSGVMQLNVQIPLNIPSGDVPIVVSVGGSTSQNGVTVSVK